MVCWIVLGWCLGVSGLCRFFCVWWCCGFWLVVLVLSSCVLASWFSLVWFATAVMFGLVIVVCGSVW